MVNQSRRNLFRLKKTAASDMVRLPWVVDEQRFIEGCTQCGDCVAACEESIIVKGDGGFPKIDFSQGECTFCQKCVDVCKEPLFEENLSEQPWLLVSKNDKPANIAIEIKNTCLATNQVHCRSCQDYCEPEAISFQFAGSSVPQPVINEGDCSGCGACISVCPQDAISIRPLTTNQVDERPKVETIRA